MYLKNKIKILNQRLSRYSTEYQISKFFKRNLINLFGKYFAKIINNKLIISNKLIFKF